MVFETNFLTVYYFKCLEKDVECFYSNHNDKTLSGILMFFPQGNIYIHGAFNKFPAFFVQAFEIVVDP